jgi:hypothetical protein
VPPGTTVSYSYENYKTSEFGAQLGFAGTARKNPTITVVMGSEACETAPPVGTFALTGLPCGWQNNAPLVAVKAAP